MNERRPTARRSLLRRALPCPHSSSLAMSSASSDSEHESPVASTSTLPAPEQPKTSFAALGVEPFLCKALQAMSIRAPTGVQAACIPPILIGQSRSASYSRALRQPSEENAKLKLNHSNTGADCIGSAQTGSGKTIAFALPIMQALAKDPYGLFAVVLTPTRCGSY